MQEEAKEEEILCSAAGSFININFENEEIDNP